MGLNVGGLTSKLNLNILEDHIYDNFDIVCLSETKLDLIDEANISIDGFSPFYHHRKSYVRKSGGLAILVNNNILPLTKVLKPSDNEYVQWLKVDPSILGFGLIIGAVYIPPVDSPYFTGHELEQLSQDIIDISANHNSYELCVIGDFNSRTSNLPDFTVTDEHLLRATGLDECLGELFVNEHTLSKLGIPIEMQCRQNH